jgi:HlyD family secretion protein
MVISLGSLGAWEFFTVKADKPTYIFGIVDRGTIVSQVVAQGTLAAVTTVDVGTQVSGTIAELYADFNSEVKKGQILAKLNQDLFLADVKQQEANVGTAKAQLSDDTAAIATSVAELEKAKVDVLDNQHKFSRQKELYDEQLISQDDYETAQAALDSAIAAQKASESQLASARAKYKEDDAKLQQARGALETSKVNLEHTIITSPISGTVINRAVDVGQTVAASFSAPVIFSIGEDLTKMQVNTNIDEADVGGIKMGMRASFSVDAYPGTTFEGTISQIRLAATTVQNVVTYDAVIDVPNPQLLLKPGMTANVKIVVEKAEDALKIPNSALRFKPTLPDTQLDEAFRKAGEEKFWSVLKKSYRPPAPAPLPSAASMGGTRGGQLLRDAGMSTKSVIRGKRVPLWVLDNDMSLRPIVAQLGLTDGMSTQIEDGKLKQGDRIIIGYEFDPNRPTPAAGSRPPGFGGPFMGGFRR